MRAIWSFWSKPFLAAHKSWWASERHHLLAWVLSVESARRFFPDTHLVTDDYGIRVLVDALQLPFQSVSSSLSRLASQDPDWWALGKLYTYREQTQPFIHIDNDVFLWKALPTRLLTAPILAQNPERFRFGGGWYCPERWQEAIDATNGWLPEEWRWYTHLKGNEAVCCGILGGQAVDFVRGYADKAIRMLEHPANRPAWASIDRVGSNILFEQYFLSACLYWQLSHDGTPLGYAGPEYLFPDERSAYHSNAPVELGYTHLLGLAKRNPTLAHRLETRVQRDYPLAYERVQSYLAAQEAT